uniref:Uncharacterized protein n=1 Tax=Rangifer tarandus platyrhynchus TaxID=3082113 RepID=A0ACB0FAI3_RANTA|nr:unnamed protein product [Rangifer tarandus platyrhynchus]
MLTGPGTSGRLSPLRSLARPTDPPAPPAKRVLAEGAAEGGLGRTAPIPASPPTPSPPAMGRGRTACGVPCTCLPAAGAPAGRPCLLCLRLVGGLRRLAGVPAPPVTSPPGKVPQGLSRVGVTPSSRPELYWNLQEACRLGEAGQAEGQGSVSASPQDCLQPEEPHGLPSAPEEGGGSGWAPAHRAAPRATADAPAFASCSRRRQAYVHGLGQGWNLGLDTHSLKNPGERGSLLLSLSFLIRQMGRTRPLPRSQVCVKAAQPPAGACAPSAVPFNTPVAAVGFSSSPARAKLAPPSPHPKTVSGRRAFQTELHPSSADPAAPGGCSCRAGRPPLQIPQVPGRPACCGAESQG